MKEQEIVNIEDLSSFLSEYAAALFASGAYTSRIIRCTQRIAQCYGYEINMIVWLNYITLSISQKDNYINRRTQVSKNPPLGVNFRIVSELSALSWQIHDNEIALKEAKLRFKHTMAMKNNDLFAIILLSSVANMAFSKLFNGDVGALICVFMGTFAGFASRHFLSKLNVDARGVYIIASFISSFVAYIGVYFGITNTPGIAIGLSILYLIPGIQIINALTDILHEHILMALSRGINMGILLVCIAVGAYLTLSIAKVSIIHHV